MLDNLRTISVAGSDPMREMGSKRPRYSAPKSYWTDVKESQHFVQFYKSDAYLVTCVAEYVLQGLNTGDTCIIADTKTHIELIDIFLAHGTDLDAARLSRRYVVLDAHDTLSKIMVEGMPDEKLFRRLVTPLLERAKSDGNKVRIFGELVSVLNDQGNSDASVRLEEYWNNLRKDHVFSLFCAYPTDNFAIGMGNSNRTHVCDEHTRVIPDETYTTLRSTDERLRTIALLQQRNAQLEAELADLESRIAER